MNVPSNGRAQQNLAGISEVQKGKREESTSVPGANAWSRSRPAR